MGPFEAADDAIAKLPSPRSVVQRKVQQTVTRAIEGLPLWNSKTEMDSNLMGQAQIQGEKIGEFGPRAHLSYFMGQAQFNGEGV